MGHQGGSLRSFGGSDGGPWGWRCVFGPPGTWMRLDDTEIWVTEQILGHHDMILTTLKTDKGNRLFWVCFQLFVCYEGAPGVGDA